MKARSPNHWTTREFPHISLTLGLRCEEEKDFRSLAVSLSVSLYFKKNKEKVHHFLFHEHISALPLAAAVAFLLFSDLGDEEAVGTADPVRM